MWPFDSISFSNQLSDTLPVNNLPAPHCRQNRSTIWGESSLPLTTGQNHLDSKHYPLLHVPPTEHVPMLKLPSQRLCVYCILCELVDMCTYMFPLAKRLCHTVYVHVVQSTASHCPYSLWPHLPPPVAYNSIALFPNLLPQLQECLWTVRFAMDAQRSLVNVRTTAGWRPVIEANPCFVCLSAVTWHCFALKVLP